MKNDACATHEILRRARELVARTTVFVFRGFSL
jgi:hypothetical protein